MAALRKHARQAIAQDEEPRAVIIDGQSIKTSRSPGNESTFALEKIWGRKRQIVTDTQGFLLAVKVDTAALSSRAGAPLL